VRGKIEYDIGIREHVNFLLSYSKDIPYDYARCLTVEIGRLTSQLERAEEALKEFGDNGNWRASDVPGCPWAWWHDDQDPTVFVQKYFAAKGKP
jgi:hypothetical protein